MAGHGVGCDGWIRCDKFRCGLAADWERQWHAAKSIGHKDMCTLADDASAQLAPITGLAIATMFNLSKPNLFR